MAQVIEFCTLARLTPTVKWAPDEERGKVIPFMFQREVSDGRVLAAYEEIESESSRCAERDESPYQPALEQAQEEETFWRTLRTPWRSSSVSSTLGPFSDGSLIRS
jgi:hypothetical protein